MKNITPNQVWGIGINGEQIQLSPAYNDHAVRFPQAINFLDHLVVNNPISGEINGVKTELHIPTRHFIGAVAVESIVKTTGIGEIYYDNACEAVYEAYQEQELRQLDSELEG